MTPKGWRVSRTTESSEVEPRVVPYSWAVGAQTLRSHDWAAPEGFFSPHLPCPWWKFPVSIPLRHFSICTFRKYLQLQPLLLSSPDSTNTNFSISFTALNLLYHLNKYIMCTFFKLHLELGKFPQALSPLTSYSSFSRFFSASFNMLPQYCGSLKHYPELHCNYYLLQYLNNHQIII